MQIHEIINEASVPNVSIIKELTKAVIHHLPDFISDDSQVKIQGSQITQSLPPLKELQEKYGDMIVPIYKKVDNLVIAITNYAYDSAKESMPYGEYLVHNNYMYIHLSRYLDGKSRDMTKDDILSIKGHLGTKTVSVPSIIAHELRHMVQSIDKSLAQYFVQQVGSPDYNYQKSPFEIDAVFTEILHDVDVNEFTAPSDFATHVLNNLASVKELSDKLKKHYYRKAAKHYYDSNTINDNEVAGDIRTRNIGKMYKQVKLIIDDVLEFAINNKSDLSDFRTVSGNQNLEAFLFDFNIPYLRKMLDKTTMIENTTKSTLMVGILMLSMVGELSNIDVSALQPLLKLSYGATKQKVIDTINDSPNIKFDKSMLIALINNNFQ